MEKIKYYPANDLACGHNLSKIDKIINKFNICENFDEDNINDMLELYNAKKYLDNEIYLIDWSDDDIKYYNDTINKHFGVVAKFFKSIDTNNFIDLYNNVQRNYKEDFWTLGDKFEIYINIDENKFKEFIKNTNVDLYELLRHKKLTEYFGQIIRECMIKNYYQSAELLLNKYEMKHLNEKKPLYLPKELINDDKQKIISKYIDDEDSNVNYLRLIANIQSNKDKIELSPKILLKAKKKAEHLEKKYFTENAGFPIETTVIFSDKQKEAFNIKIEELSITAKYSTNWIKENSNYATLLNNFIYLFEYVDNQMRCKLVNKLNEMGVMERTLKTNSINDYIYGIGFIQKNALSLLQIKSYYNELFSIGIRLEEIIEWFFEEYLAIEFNASNFKINMPSAESTMLEKCTNIMPAIESVLKQFILFEEDREIDFELLEIRSEHLVYENIPSLVERKYVYGIGKEYNNATFLIFSDQSSLAYVEKVKKSYRNFYELIYNENVKIKDYHDYSNQKINWLIDNNYILIDEYDYIKFNNKFLIMILKDLYYNEVISYWKYSKHSRDIMDELEIRNVIEFESSLFSRPEQAYINYFLNKSQFNNGLDLRNKYSHTQPDINNEDIHKQNYMMFLRFTILTVIKINDDFYTYDLISE